MGDSWKLKGNTHVSKVMVLCHIYSILNIILEVEY